MEALRILRDTHLGLIPTVKQAIKHRALATRPIHYNPYRLDGKEKIVKRQKLIDYFPYI